MEINGVYYTEPELASKVRQMQQVIDHLYTENDLLVDKVIEGDKREREFKRLLKAAVEDMRWVNENTQDADGTCIMRNCEGCGDCPLDINGDLWCKWKHEADALELIGEEP